MASSPHRRHEERTGPVPAPDAPTGGQGVGDAVLRQTATFALLRTLSSLLTWLGVVTLSRLLEPRAFGVFELGFFWVGLGQLIGDGGSAAALIRQRGELSPRHYQVAFTLAFGLAAVMAAMFYLGAPVVGHASGLSEHEISALRALSPLYLVPVLRLVPYVKLQREINFGLLGRIELAANFVRYAVAIVAAVLFNSVWALIASQVAWNVTQIAGAFLVRPGFAGFGWDARIVRDLLGFGSKMQLGNMFLYMKNNVGRGLLAFLLGPSAVGTFGFGLNFVNVPPDAVNGLARVQFPAYARLSRDDPALYQLLQGTIRGSLIVGLPLLGVLVSVADWLIPVVYSAQWLPSLPVVWSLVPHVMGDLLITHLMTFNQAQGRAGFALTMYATWAFALWGLVLFVLSFLGEELALVGACYGVATTLTVTLLLRGVGRYLRRSLFPDLIGPIAAASIAMLLSYVLRTRLGEPSLVNALVLLVTFAILFVSVMFALERQRAWEDLRRALRSLRAGKERPA